ncbi:MAG: hypothetical protein QOC94_197 [Actinoplanes sp.]|jgi:hypothetical protein|nr:hypothetical protein [Actinoplanes sp.]
MAAEKCGHREAPRRFRRGRVLALTVLAAMAVTVAALPVLRASAGGQAAAQTLAACSGQHQRNCLPTASVSSSAPAAAAATSAPAGTAKGVGQYITLGTPVQPIPQPSTKVPFAQYREMHANCTVVKQAPDDPLVFPGLPGASHLHTFVGNTAPNASSTPESLRTSGASSCEDAKDTASYWFPTLLQNGKPVPNTTVTFYYKSGVKDYRTVRPFPAGFRELVGDMKTPDAASFGGEWDCGKPGGTTKEIPASCPKGNVLIVRYMAPSCWDGVHLDTPNHKSHLAYPVKGVCPADHPVAVPMLQSKVAYKLTDGVTRGLAFSSGASFSFHYDFMNGWPQARLEELVKHCINGGRQCNGYGVDEHKP